MTASEAAGGTAPTWTSTPGALLEPLGLVWAAYSPSSGETTLLNDSAAAALEIVRAQPCSTDELAAQLAADAGVPASEVTAAAVDVVLQLRVAGLIRAA